MRPLRHPLRGGTIITHHEIGPDEHAVLFSRDGSFSACIVRPRRLVASCPNYSADGIGLLSGPLTAEGLADLLHWTDHATATHRFRALANLPPNVLTMIRPNGGPPAE